MKGVYLVICLLVSMCVYVTSTVTDYRYVNSEPPQRGAVISIFETGDFFEDEQDDDSNSDYDWNDNAIPGIFDPTVIDAGYGNNEGVETPEQDVFPVENENPVHKPIADPEFMTIEKLTEKIDKLMFEVKSLQDKVRDLEKLNTDLEDKVDRLEQLEKTNNVIFYNVAENKNENHHMTLQKVLHIINRNLRVRGVKAEDIAMALRVQHNSTKDVTRPIVVRFANFATKMKVLGVKNRLNHLNIAVSGDYSERVAKTRKELVPFMLAARSQGYHAFILYDKLVVNGVRKTLKELQADIEDEDKPVESPETSKDPDEQVEEIEIDTHHQPSESEEE